VAGPDGQPQISIGGRLLSITGDKIQLPLGLIMPEREQRVIQQVAERQNRQQPAMPPSERVHGPPRQVPTDSVGDPIPSMRSLHLSEEDKRLVSAFREQADGREDSAVQEDGTVPEKALYRGGHIPSRLFRSLESTVSGGTAPPSRIGGPGQGRAVIVNMRPGRAGGTGSAPAARTDPAEATKKNPSRSFRLLQQMTADQQDS